jgi:glycosyltransferase involved in cell wall biosynthesis
MRLPITAIVLTKNEERNLEACLASVVGRVSAIRIVDCGSTDGTLEIARAFGASVLHHPWTNYAHQFKWALEKCEIDTPWILRLDADERWTPEGWETLVPILNDAGVAGVTVRMRIMFMGRFLRHGGLYPNEFLRVFRPQGARIEQRWMDEHIHVTGAVRSAAIDVVESNHDRQENIGVWIEKHNTYATREAVDVLVARHGLGSVDSIANLHGGSTERRRWMKEHVYSRVPLFVRPALYWVYRYFLKGGFLDGTPGFIYAVLHAFWYRFLVDVKVYQVEQLARRKRQTVAQVIKDSFGIDLGAVQGS